MTPAQIEEARAIASRPGRAVVMRAVRDVSTESRISESIIMGHSRAPHVVAARHLAIRVAHSAGVSASEIARVMGRDHTTIIHAIRKGAACAS